MAEWSLELGARRPIGGTPRQRIYPRSIRLSAYNDGVHDLDGNHDFYPRLCTLLAGSSVWRSDVRNFVGSLSGRPLTQSITA